MYLQVYNGLVDKNTYIHSIAQDSATSGFMPLLHLNSLTTFPALLGNMQWKKLDSISIYDKTLGQVIQRFRLSYNNNSTQRLMLQSIVETNPTGAGNNRKPPYLFYYDSSNALPGYLSRLVDDWGTYNGSSYLSAYDIKPASAMYAGAGTLNKIVYPTGGNTRFFFESNDFYAKVNQVRTSPLTVYPNSQLAGGLRIKAIYNFDPISQQVSSKHYYYIKNFHVKNFASTGIQLSSGVLGSSPVPHFYVAAYTDPSTNDQLDTWLWAYKTVIPLTSNTMGKFIGYSEVAEMADDSSYTISKFTNYDDGHMDEGYIQALYPDKSAMEPYTSLDLERGKLKSSASFTKSDVRLSSSAIQYAPLHNQKNFVKSVFTYKWKTCGYGQQVGYSTQTGSSFLEGVSYKIYTYSFFPVSQVDTLFDETGQNPVVSATNFYYDNPNTRLLTRAERARTDGNVVTSASIYPPDYAAGTAFIDSMISKNIVAFPVERVTYFTNAATGKVNVLSGESTVRLSTDPLLRSAVYTWSSPAPIMLDSFKFSSRPFATLPDSASAGAYQLDKKYQLKITYDNYDAFGNLQQYTVVNGASGGMLAAYNHTMPVAEFKNATFNTVYYTGFEGDTVNVSTDSKMGSKSKLLNGISYSLPVMPALPSGNQYVLSYWYKNTGDVSWSFSQNNYSTLPASITGPQEIDEVRIIPLGASMKSFSYASPLVGMSGNDNESNVITNYSYDALNRLNVIRDDKNNILKELSYSYSPGSAAITNFYANQTLIKSFTTSCASGQLATTFNYTVPAAAYTSKTSQAQADSLAQADANANGQTLANEYGTCLFKSAAQSGTVYKQCTGSPNCTYKIPYAYSVAAGKYTAATSQAAADSLATADYTSKGPLAADYNISCPLSEGISVTDNVNNKTQIAVMLTNTCTNTVYNVVVSVGIYANTPPPQKKSISIPPGIYNIQVTESGGPADASVVIGTGSYCFSGGSGTLSNMLLYQGVTITLNASGSCAL